VNASDLHRTPWPWPRRNAPPGHGFFGFFGRVRHGDPPVAGRGLRVSRSGARGCEEPGIWRKGGKQESDGHSGISKVRRTALASRNRGAPSGCIPRTAACATARARKPAPRRPRAQARFGVLMPRNGASAEAAYVSSPQRCALPVVAFLAIPWSSPASRRTVAFLALAGPGAPRLLGLSRQAPRWATRGRRGGLGCARRAPVNGFRRRFGATSHAPLYVCAVGFLRCLGPFARPRDACGSPREIWLVFSVWAESEIPVLALQAPRRLPAACVVLVLALAERWLWR